MGEQLLIELARQTPALTVLVILVYYFLKYLSKHQAASSEVMRNITEQWRDFLKQQNEYTTTALKEMASDINRLGEKIDQLNAKFETRLSSIEVLVSKHDAKITQQRRKENGE